jgi:deoxyadenosine/deoxycytidine kinase
MIILIEGPRGAGKSHLVDQFMLRNQNPDVLYYKFEFSDWIKKLRIEDQENGPGVHYFSISNIITILGITETLLKGKTIVFDRSIFSAYVWSVFRDRMEGNRLINEFAKILKDELYSNCKLIHVTKSDPDVVIERDKDDIFNIYEDYKTEAQLYDNLICLFETEILDSRKGNEMFEFKNDFDPESESRFNTLLNNLIDK